MHGIAHGSAEPCQQGHGKGRVQLLAAVMFVRCVQVLPKLGSAPCRNDALLAASPGPVPGHPL